jgi:hypothetical protein
MIRAAGLRSRRVFLWRRWLAGRYTPAMNIVTSADAKFFHCLAPLVASVRDHYDRQAIVYDLGLTAEQAAELDATVHEINVDVTFDEWLDVGETTFIQATHKPMCVRDYWQHYAEPMAFVDADCFFRQHVEFGDDFDVAVTMKTGKGLDLADRFGGILNTGVVVFNNAATPLVDAWIDACRQPGTTDQKAMVDVLSESVDWSAGHGRVWDWRGLRIKVLDTDTYNDFHLRDGQIYHFKGGRHDQATYTQLIEAVRQGKNVRSVYKSLTGRKKPWYKRLFG